MQELRNWLRGFSDKTFYRDISILRRAGVPIHFSVQRKAFVLIDETGKEIRRPMLREPDYPESKKEKQYIDKTIRLIKIMDKMPYEDCDVWYRENFPEISERTMHRDFAILKTVGPGYVIYYKRAWENPYDKDDEEPPGHYYYDEVCNP